MISRINEISVGRTKICGRQSPGGPSDHLSSEIEKLKYQIIEAS